MIRHIFCIVALAGCGDIIGLSGYTDQDGGLPADARADALSDGPAKDVVGTDNCAPSAEDCTNGKDDDCNGLADCADPACQTGFSCVPPIPMGWTTTEYNADARGACSTGYAMPLDVEEGITAAGAMCGCGCTTTQPTCTGNVTIMAGKNGGNCNNTSSQTQPATANCTALTQFTSSGDDARSTGPSPSGGSCAPNPTKNVPGVMYQHQGRTCAYGGMVGAGCTSQNVCIAKTAASVCVAKTGMNACPTGYMVQHLVGSMLADTRDCSACTCNFTAGTCGGTLTLYSDVQCMLNAQNVTVNNMCQAIPNQTWRAYKYAATTNGSCAPSMSNATGTATFSDLQTVCCTM